MATELELESIVTHLTGDGSEFKRMMDDAVAQTKMAAAQVQAAGAQIEGVKNSWNAFGQAAVGALAAFGTTSFLKSAFNSFVELETGQIKLKAAIEANGGSVTATMAQYDAFSVTLRNTLGIGKNATMELLRQAETYGLTGTMAQQTAQKAIALSAAVDGNTESAGNYIRVAAALQRGDVEQLRHLSRIVPQLRSAKNDTELMAKAQQLLAIGNKTAAEVMNSTQGVMNRFHATVGALTKQFGSLVADAVKPVIVWVTGLLQNFTNLDAGTKKWIVTGALIISALLAIGPAIGVIMAVVGPLIGFAVTGFGLIGSVIGALMSPLALIGGLFGILGTIAATVFSPIGIAVMLVVAVIAILANKLGGIGPLWEAIKDAAVGAWTWVKQTVSDFVAWLMPIVAAYVGVIKAGWEIVWQAAQAAFDIVVSVLKSVWEFITSVWQSIFGNSSSTWKGIKDMIVDNLITAEFQIRNFDRYANFAWTSVKLGFVSLVNEIEHFFTGVMPALLQWFGDNWIQVFETAFNFAKTGLENMVKNLASIISSIPGLIAGTTKWEDVWTPLTQGAVVTLKELPNIPKRELGEVEKQIAEEWERQKDSLVVDFNKFREQRLKEIGEFKIEIPGLPGVKKKANDAGMDLGNTLAGSFKEAAKFDAVVLQSAEAIARITAYQDRLEGMGKHGMSTAGLPGAGGASGHAPAVPGPFDPNPPRPGQVPPVANVPAPDADKNKILSVLEAIRDYAKEIRDKDQVVIVDAGLIG